MLRRSFLAAAALLPGGSLLAADDPLLSPARRSALAQRRQITGIARAGAAALVAVGERGHVLRSSDEGKTWVQATVPVSSDLNAVQFVDERVGHAVGHDGVVLRSEDGGATWTRVLDGRMANELLLAHMQRVVAEGGGKAERKLLQEAERNQALGPDKPFLDVWFDSADEGFVVGAYNLIFRTSDGGRHWTPWFERTDNPRLLNLYAIRPAMGSVFVVGEAGLLLKLDAARQRFQALATPYPGSFFGLIGTAGAALAFGMRGNAWISRDAGATWQPAKSGLNASITAGAVAADGRLALVDQAGGVALSADGGEHFMRLPRGVPMPLSAVALTAHSAVLGGPRGLRTIDLPKDLA